MTTRTPRSRSAAQSGAGVAARRPRTGCTTSGGQPPAARSRRTTAARSVGAGALDEDRVGAGLGEGDAALDGGLDALDAAARRCAATTTMPLSASTAARTRAAASRDVDDLLAGEVAAALGRDLVLEVQAGDAGGGVRPGGGPGLERVAVAGVGVGEQRQAVERRVRRSARPATMSVPCTKPRSGRPSCDRRGDRTGQVRADDAGAGGEPGADRVVHAGQVDQVRSAQGAQARGAESAAVIVRAGRTCPRRRRPGRR